MRLKRLLLVMAPLPVAGVLFLACKGPDLDLGENEHGDDASTAESADGAGNGSQAEGDDETWSGYIESYTDPLGSDALVLTFTREADGGVSGHARFGNAPLFAPPTDPHAGYPVTSSEAGSIDYSLEGFRYPFRSGRFDGVRLRAAITNSDLYTQWCALQTPFPYGSEPDGGLAYRCLPVAGFENIGGEGCFLFYDSGAPTVPVACGWADMCQDNDTFCDCTAAGCTSADTSGPTTFDFRIDGAQASGSVDLSSDNSPLNIHLTRQ